MKTITDSTGKEYLQSEATQLCYNPETPQKVIDIIEKAFYCKERIAIRYGDQKTGRDWQDMRVSGTIGQSTGSIKIPLLIKTRRSRGGESVLTHCIIKTTSKDYRLNYVHPNYHNEKV